MAKTLTTINPVIKKLNQPIPTMVINLRLSVFFIIKTHVLRIWDLKAKLAKESEQRSIEAANEKAKYEAEQA